MWWSIVNQLTDKVLDRLQRVGVVCAVRRSKTSVSVYLDLDYGALGTLRISDHVSAESADYQYTMVTKNQTELRLVAPNVDRVFAAEELDRLIRRIRRDRDQTIQAIGQQQYNRLIALGTDREY